MTVYIDKFYLNVVLLNSKELVAAKVQEKVGKNIFGIIVAKAVTSSIDDDAKKWKMAPALQTRIKEMGIDVTAKTTYVNGPLFVV